MQKLLIATKNKGKLEELTSFFLDLPIKLLSLSDIGIDDDFEEKGETYQENSQGKAIFYSKKSRLPTIADDGGIEISALGGKPGSKSRRWLGHEATDEELIEHMISVSKNLPDSNRKAFFKTCVSFAMPDGRVWSSFGKVEGEIAKKPHLKLLKGYPYRSFFFLPEINKYYHESDLTPEEMKAYNHRYKAVSKLKPVVIRKLGL